MDTRFFEQPILNSPYEYPARHWELDASGQPTNKLLDKRRKVAFITPIPKPKKRRGVQREIVFDAVAQVLETETQQYDLIALISGVRQRVDRWRKLRRRRSRDAGGCRERERNCVALRRMVRFAHGLWSCRVRRFGFFGSGT